MIAPSLSILAPIAVILALLAAETASFQLAPKGRPSLGFTRPMDSVKSDWSLSESTEPRRDFVVDLLSKGAMLTGICSTLPQSAVAEDLVSAGAIKVTAIAHTFVTTGKSPSPKPIRENDATRFFTNAKVVYIFEGSSNSDNDKLAQEVTELTRQRKAEQGPGVTPGNLVTLVPDNKGSGIVSRVVEKAKQMSEGDVLVVGPIPSQGTAGDGKLLASTASDLGTFVGGQKGQGVISVLLNGPKENLKLVESGFPASELLWYSLPPKK